MERLFDIDAAWLWMIAGIVLCVLELLVPGVYLLWIGVAALATGLVAMVTGITLVPQLAMFALLAVVSIYLGKRLVTDKGMGSEDPLLNDRLARMVGDTVEVETALVGGQGRVRVGDSVWPAHGPDMPTGTRARIVSARSNGLTIEPLS